MNSAAILMMISTLMVVSIMTGYFFFKVLTIPPKSGAAPKTEKEGQQTQNTDQ
jgi:hypothetical protein